MGMKPCLPLRHCPLCTSVTLSQVLVTCICDIRCPRVPTHPGGLTSANATLPSSLQSSRPQHRLQDQGQLPMQLLGHLRWG